MSIGFKDYLFKYLKDKQQDEAVIDIPRQTYATGVFSNPEDKDPKTLSRQDCLDLMENQTKK